MNWKKIASTVSVIIAILGGTGYVIAQNSIRISQLENQTKKCYSNGERLSAIETDLRWIARKLGKKE